MRLTVLGALDPATVDAFYPAYAAAFEPLRTRAAARHILSAAEFAEEMTDPRIDKYVVWTDDGEPVAMTTMTTDLSAVAWISPEYFAARYPEHYARGAVYYLGYTLVGPGRKRHGAFALMMDAVVRRLIEGRAVCAFDICAYNDERGIGRRIAALCRAGNSTIDPVDVQTYYAASFGGPQLSGASA